VALQAGRAKLHAAREVEPSLEQHVAGGHGFGIFRHEWSRLGAGRRGGAEDGQHGGKYETDRFHEELLPCRPVAAMYARRGWGAIRCPILTRTRPMWPEVQN
jgi:hypothetical protein